MAKKISCTFIPNVPNTEEPSKLYQDLYNLIKNRPLGNLIYASYLQPGVAAEMNNFGYVVNSQGQHRAEDVFKFFNGAEIKSELLSDIKQVSKSFGFMDKSDTLIDFKDAEEAYQKAQEFNNTSKGRVAYVVSHGDYFNILVEEKNSRTQHKVAELNQDIVRWDKLKQELTDRGISLDELIKVAPELVNPNKVSDFIRNISALQYSPIDGLSIKNIKLLLLLNPKVTPVAALLSGRWGDLNETAQKIYDIIHKTISVTQGNESLANSVLTSAKQFPYLRKEELINSLKEVSETFEQTDKDTNISKTLQELDEKYHLESEVIIRKEKQIGKLSDAIADSIISLKRQIRNIEIKKGTTPQSEELNIIQSKLLSEIESKQYTAGLLAFLKRAINYLQQVNINLESIDNTGTNLQYAANISDAVVQAQNLHDAYYDIVNALANLDKLLIDLSITDKEKEELKDTAVSLKQLFDSQTYKIEDLQRIAMISVGKTFLGESNSLYGKDLADIISMAEADTSLMDYLYSVGRSSNAVVSVMGALIRDAQNERDKKLSRISLRIRRAQDKLNKDGKDSSFMYKKIFDKKGNLINQYIVSKYDWETFYKKKFSYRDKLVYAGFLEGTPEFNAEMQLWEDQNTTDLEVDAVNHRFEKVPIYTLNTPFDAEWSQAQKEYYEEMMQIKGEIGTILPSYAQHQFIAPQKRTSWDQIVKEGFKGERSLGDVATRLIDRLKFWKIRSDDTNFQRNGMLIDGEQVIASTSSFDNTILRQIPIFYINKLKDQGDLTHDFSSAVQALASTAFNYEAMDHIKNLCELMTDYVENKSPIERDKNGFEKVDSVIRRGIGVARALRKTGKETNTTSMAESFVLQHIYGISSRNQGKWAIICSNLIGYTSFKGLAVNVKGALTNKFVGILQSIIKAGGGQYFNFKELARAEMILMGSNGAATTGTLVGGLVGGLPGAAVGATIGVATGIGGLAGGNGKIMDILTDNKNSKDSLIAEFFDVSQENYSTLSNTRYHSHMFTRLFGKFDFMHMYTGGEYWIHMLNTYAILLHEKVISYDPTTGKRKKISLYEALEVGDKIDNNSILKVKDNVVKIDGTKIDDTYLDGIKRRVRYVNQQCHGSMNKEDKGLIHQWMLGKLTMNFRQWMIEHYSRRYRGLHWDESIRDVNLSNFYTKTKVLLNGKKVSLYDALEQVDSNNDDRAFTLRIKKGTTTISNKPLTEEILNNMLNKYAEDSGWRRGFWTDTVKVTSDYLKDYREFKTSAIAYWDTLSETQKADVRQALTECIVLLALFGLSACMGDPDDHRGEFFFKLWMYVVKRCLFDEIAAVPTGAIVELKTIVNNPIASTQTVSGLLYPIYGLGDIGETVQSGLYEGWNKYLKNVVKYTVPFYHQVNQLINLDEDTSVFNVFDNQLTR